MNGVPERAIWAGNTVVVSRAAVRKEMEDMSQESKYPQLSAKLAASLDLRQPPVAICFTDSIPAGMSGHAGRVPDGRLGTRHLMFIP